MVLFRARAGVAIAAARAAALTNQLQRFESRILDRAWSTGD